MEHIRMIVWACIARYLLWSRILFLASYVYGTQLHSTTLQYIDIQIRQVYNSLIGTLNFKKSFGWINMAKLATEVVEARKIWGMHILW